MAHTQFTDNGLPRRYSAANGFTTVRGVRQDKTAPTYVRVATIQPALRIHLTRTRQMNILFSRSQNYFNNSFLTDISSSSFTHSLAWVHMYPAPDIEFHSQPRKRSKKRRTVQVNLWVKPQLKAELKRIASIEGLSVSQTGGAALEEWVRSQLHIQHTVLIQPIIETTIRKELRSSFSRIILFQARITLTLDVIKGLVKWLCRRLAGANNSQIEIVEARSRKDARLNLGSRTAQLEQITEEFRKALMIDVEGTN